MFLIVFYAHIFFIILFSKFLIVLYSHHTFFKSCYIPCYNVLYVLFPYIPSWFSFQSLYVFNFEFHSHVYMYCVSSFHFLNDPKFHLILMPFIYILIVIHKTYIYLYILEIISTIFNLNKFYKKHIL